MNGAIDALIVASLALPKILRKVAWNLSLVQTKMCISWCTEGLNGPEMSLALISTFRWCVMQKLCYGMQTGENPIDPFNSTPRLGTHTGRLTGRRGCPQRSLSAHSLRHSRVVGRRSADTALTSLGAWQKQPQTVTLSEKFTSNLKSNSDRNSIKLVKKQRANEWNWNLQCNKQMWILYLRHVQINWGSLASPP